MNAIPRQFNQGNVAAEVRPGGTARWIVSSGASSRIPDPPEVWSGKDAAEPAGVRGLDSNYLIIK